MGVYPGHYLGKWEDMPPPILTEIPKTHYDPTAQPTGKATTLNGSFSYFPETRILTLNGQCSVTEFAPEQPWSWSFQCDELHYILQGKAEMIYSLGGTFHTERKTMHVEAGDVYIIPLGARIEWKVDPEYGPLRALNVIMPGHPSPRHLPGSQSAVKKTN
jgi:mannose-6-phosphate isomerase-like protein (cupin superfamily)